MLIRRASSPHDGFLSGRPLHVIDDQEIEAAVVVVVEPAAADGEVAAGDARGFRDVLESPVAAIAIELIRAHAGDEQIDVAVVVEVACRCPDRVAGARQAGRGRHVREAHAAVVAVETIRVDRRHLVERRGLRAVGEEDVGAAIAVVVEHRDAARDALDEVLLGGRRVLVNEPQPGRLRDVRQANAGR